MTYRTLHNRPSRQRGVATLLVALVIMVALTLLVFFSARTALQEERMAANEVRMKQTASAAQAGVESAISYLKEGGTDTTHQGTKTASDGTVYHFAFVPRDELDKLPDCPADPNDFGTEAANVGTPDDDNGGLRRTGIWSCGWSDDRNARKGIATASSGAPSLADPPTNPLTSRGGVDTNGAARVFNAFNNLTIWSGADLSITGNPGNTYIARDDQQATVDPDGWVHDAPNNACGDNAMYICTTDAGGQGPDVVDQDLQLASLSDDEFFRNFMGQDPAQYRDTVPTMLDPDMADIDGAENEVIWFSEDADLDGNVGTRENPVVIVVDGDASLTGNFEMYGVLYVREDLRANGTPRVFGSTVVQGNSTDVGGTPHFVFDPIAAEGAGDLGARSGVAGAWRDWTSMEAP